MYIRISGLERAEHVFLRRSTKVIRSHDLFSINRSYGPSRITIASLAFAHHRDHGRESVALARSPCHRRARGAADSRDDRSTIGTGYEILLTPRIPEPRHASPTASREFVAPIRERERAVPRLAVIGLVRLSIRLDESTTVSLSILSCCDNLSNLCRNFRLFESVSKRCSQASNPCDRRSRSSLNVA